MLLALLGLLRCLSVTIPLLFLSERRSAPDDLSPRWLARGVGDQLGLHDDLLVRPRRPLSTQLDSDTEASTRGALQRDEVSHLLPRLAPGLLLGLRCQLARELLRNWD